MKTRVLSLFIAAAIAAGTAGAALASPEKKPRAETAQQQAARAEIDRLVKRIEELSKQLGDDGDVRVIVRGDRDGPMEWHGKDFPRHFEFEDGEGKRKVRIERIERIGGPGDAPRALPPGGQWEMRTPPPHGSMLGNGAGLGIVLASNPAAAGVRIAAVTPDSPAMRAGVRTGDVVLQVNGKTISGAGNAAVENARAMIGELKKGQVVKLRYARQGKTRDASIKADDIRRVWAWSGDAVAPKAWSGAPEPLEIELQRLGDGDCHKGKKDCGLPVIYEAFRWQGLNLASLDAGLGRYFGTQQGVLVLSSGDELKALQSGDVIQKVGGSAVDSPRDVMRALRNKDDGASVRMDVWRDRRLAAVTVVVPKSRPLPFITPPPAPPAPPPPMAPRAPMPPHAAPPAPPAAPMAPRAAPPAPPAPPVPPTPPPSRGGAVWIDDDDGAEVYFARAGEAPEAIEDADIELIEVPER